MQKLEQIPSRIITRYSSTENTLRGCQQFQRDNTIEPICCTRAYRCAQSEGQFLNNDLALALE